MRYFAAALGVLLLAAPASNAVAQPFPRDDGQVQSLDTIINIIRRSFPGQVSDVQGPFGGRYRVKWLTPDGRVLWVDADARTGRILGVEGGGGGGGQRNFGPPNFMDRGTAVAPPGYEDERPPRGVRPRPENPRMRPGWNNRNQQEDQEDNQGRFRGRRFER